MSNVILNEAQRAAVSWYFNPENKSGDVWSLDEPVTIEISNGWLIVNHNYLDLDGEWCTFPSNYFTPPCRDRELRIPKKEERNSEGGINGEN